MISRKHRRRTSRHRLCCATNDGDSRRPAANLKSTSRGFFVLNSSKICERTGPIELLVLAWREVGEPLVRPGQPLFFLSLIFFFSSPFHSLSLFFSLLLSILGVQKKRTTFETRCPVRENDKSQSD